MPSATNFVSTTNQELREQLRMLRSQILPEIGNFALSVKKATDDDIILVGTRRAKRHPCQGRLECSEFPESGFGCHRMEMPGRRHGRSTLEILPAYSSQSGPRWRLEIQMD